MTRKDAEIATEVVFAMKITFGGPITLSANGQVALTVLAVLGATAAAYLLKTEYAGFVDSVRMLIHEFGPVTWWIIQPAYAQTPSGSVASKEVILPIFVYGMYVLLGFAYLVTLFGMFFGKQPKDRANALAVFYNLNAFFIGAVSGKIV